MKKIIILTLLLFITSCSDIQIIHPNCNEEECYGPEENDFGGTDGMGGGEESRASHGHSR